MENSHGEACCEGTGHDEQTARQTLVDAPTAERLAQTFSALADPTRVRILSALAGTELCVGDLAATLEMSMSAISHQLHLLRELRIVRNRRAGKHIFYALDDEHIHDLFRRGLEHVQHE